MRLVCLFVVLLSACSQVNSVARVLAERQAVPVTRASRADDLPTQQTVYAADECIGAIVNGECHGSILPKSATHPTCYGTMLNGQCTGPLF